MLESSAARTTRAILTLGIIGVLAAGCTASPTEPEETATVEALPAPEPTPARTPIIIAWKDFPASTPSTTSERGNLIKQVGETAGVGADPESSLIQFMVQSITVAPECEGGDEAPEPENGYFVRVDIQGEASPELAQAYEEGGVLPLLSFGDWTAIDSNGVTSNAPTITESSIACLTSAESVYYTDVEPGNKAVGSVVLDLPFENGTLVFHWGDFGWEIPF